MTTDNFIAGLKILERYYDSPGGYSLGAEHDVIYAYQTDRPVEQEDLEKLIELGWIQEDRDNYEEEFAPKHYDPYQGWCAYV